MAAMVTMVGRGFRALVGFVLSGLVLGGGVAAAAWAAPSETTVDLQPASTSVDQAPDCDLGPLPTIAPDDDPSGTVITFRVLPPGC